MRSNFSSYGLLILVALGGTFGRTARAEDDVVCRPETGASEFERAGWSADKAELYDFAKKIAGLKSDDDVDDYVACWNKGSKFESIYETEYRKYMKASEAVGGPPYAILSCLFFRESIEWDAKINSPAGARGLAQLMDETFRSTVNAIKKPKYGKMYDAYVAKVGHPPARLLATDAEAAIILGSIHLVEVYHELFGDLPPTPDRWLIASGGYNSETSAKRCGADMSVEDCIAAVRKRESHMKRDKHGKIRHENSNHMISVENCAIDGISTPMVGRHGSTCGS